MPNPNVATESQAPDATGLEDAIFGTDSQEGEAKKPEVEEEEGTENESEESTDDNQNDDTDESEAGTEETDESSEEGEEGSEDEGADEKSYRIGNQVFATVEDAIGEATRVIGRNAQLAGALRTAEAAQASVAEQLKEALEANKQWAEWAEAQGKGENRPMPNQPNLDPSAIAEQVVKTLDSRQSIQAQKDAIAKEVEAIIALPNFKDAAALIDSIADKNNPLTGKLYTPNEAYDFAVAHLGLKNLRKQGGQVKQPKKLDRSAVKGAAARPAASRMSNPPKAKTDKSFADEMLAEQIL